MADPVGKAVLDVVQKDCSSITCPYRTGDGDAIRKKFRNLVEKKLEYRVADGDKVRELEKRVKELETALGQALDLAASLKPNGRLIHKLREVHTPPKKEKK